ncbi:Ig-like domain-containing protein [Ammoniphilus sp. CFH 90114]|uniref:Ig-like domain-containing protein n=1 Tax=Ammoniphilus sp. CFH 90114 TaxID=2493665 RepID=UPI00100E370D|nr:hypothetical protein [Ammoniphilus sp. CFH 90114]RXT15281.1 hypothetical protein EIZ39_03475 [Ammoniphilus sp. CFH 90114]
MNATTSKSIRWIRWTAILSILTGLLYIPYFPWYLLGDETESEIMIWGILAIGGGALAWIGSSLVALESRAIRQISLLTAFIGMFLFILGQVPPLYYWYLFAGVPITEGSAEQVTTGSYTYMLPHIAVVVLAVATMVVIGTELFSTRSSSRLSAKQTMAAIGTILFILSGWFGWDKYQDANWISYTYPQHGAINVPLYDTVTVQWKEEASSMGMSVTYADDPTIRVQGSTSGSKDGMSFTPDMFLPGKEVLVEVTAGRRSHSFSFTTALEADDRIGLYRAVLAHIFRSPQSGQPPEVLAFDTASLKNAKEDEKRTIARGLMAYHGQVVYGSVGAGFTSAEPSFLVPLEEQTEALLLSIEILEEVFDEYHIRVIGTKGPGVLSGMPGQVYELDYTLRFQDGIWQITTITEQDTVRPWG